MATAEKQSLREGSPQHISYNLNLPAVNSNNITAPKRTRWPGEFSILRISSSLHSPGSTSPPLESTSRILEASACEILDSELDNVTFHITKSRKVSLRVFREFKTAIQSSTPVAVSKTGQCTALSRGDAAIRGMIRQKWTNQKTRTWNPAPHLLHIGWGLLLCYFKVNLEWLEHF